MFYFQSLDSRLIIYSCDFFKMTPKILEHGKCDAVYDRGAFDAIFESDREEYVKTIFSLLNHDFRYLLNIYDYENEIFQGPSDSKQKIEELFSRNFVSDGLITKIEVIEESSYETEGVQFTGMY